jgi:prepilin-type N-terminal cleavage/methylation domain-containing protein
MKSNTSICVFKLDQGGFTLIELVIIIVVLGILAAVAIPKFSDMSDSSKISATKMELTALKRAVVGNPAVTAGGAYVNRGFEGDVGHLPQRLQDLVAKPDSILTYNPLTRLGWNGPYLDGDGGVYLDDAWDASYVYQPFGRQILSTGGGDTIKVTF